ncbi:hypothetical protein [Streptomyces sp. N35]|uniref:hypothetical protein n=1 Tax=Streptomyces sp. N35 TaxID=2795730 RepID=UPI001F4705EF|nr:hypothetical protein [Streptomyces sp. N35]
MPEPLSRTRMQVLGVHLYLEDADGRVLLGLRHPVPCTRPAIASIAAGVPYAEMGWTA